MEVYSIDSVYSTNLETGESIEYQPFFACRHASEARGRQPYWHARRAASPRKNDRGTDIYLSLVDLQFNPRLPPVDVLNVSTTCTNRDLPGELRTSGGESWGFNLEGQAPLRRIDPVVAPTLPARIPLDESRWRLVSHLSLNHLSIVDEQQGADALREILKLYDFTNSRVAAQHIAGIESVRSRRRTARLTDGLSAGFCRGVEITVEFDPEKYVGTGMYLFASVLDRFFGLYASINSFTRMIAGTKQSDEPFKRWPYRAGEQTLM
jgi:type VI secretion system protein ImpG